MHHWVHGGRQGRAFRELERDEEHLRFVGSGSPPHGGDRVRFLPPHTAVHTPREGSVQTGLLRVLVHTLR